MKTLIVLLAVAALAGCMTKPVKEPVRTTEQLVEDCVANLLATSNAGPVYLTRATEACSHIYGLDHVRQLEAEELNNE